MKRETNADLGVSVSVSSAKKKPSWAKPGMRFGKLTLIGYDEMSSERHPKWFMRCDCGTQKSIDVGAVRAGRQVSCGCFHIKRVKETKTTDLSGQKIGMLTVRRLYGKRGRVLLWLCECDCGCGYIADASHLIRRMVKSCGCLRRKFTEANKSAKQLRKYATNHNRRAAMRGSSGSFSAADISSLYRLQRGRCACCGVSLKEGYHRDHKTPLALGGDNSIGNIELLCARCNTRKNSKDPIVWANENGRLL